jgi:hypothetical protein
MTFYLVPIVEGQTEVGCIERLLQRIWTELLTAPDRLQVLAVSRGHRDALIDPEHQEFADKIEEAFLTLSQRLHRDSSGRGLVLLLLDAESDCPAELGPMLLAAARQVRSDAPVACVLAKRMLENWFKAAAASLAGVCGLPADLTAPANPEEGSGDAWLTRQMQLKDRRRKYTKPGDAVQFARRMDLQQCRTNAPSFDKLCRELAARLPPPPSPPEATDDSPTTEAET